MDALHCSEDAKFREAGNIRWIDMLRVLDSPTQVSLAGEYFFIDIEHFAIGAIADGVTHN